MMELSLDVVMRTASQILFVLLDVNEKLIVYVGTDHMVLTFFALTKPGKQEKVHRP